MYALTWQKHLLQCKRFVPKLETMAVSSDMLAAFVKVVDCASVSRAALELGVGKSVVSKRVALLEQLVGATLFARSTRRIALTPAGEAYADFARRALAEMIAGEERLLALRSELTGRIRLSATVSWGQRVLAVKLPEFLRLHPAIEVELQLAESHGRRRLRKNRHCPTLVVNTTPRSGERARGDGRMGPGRCASLLGQRRDARDTCRLGPA